MKQKGLCFKQSDVRDMHGKRNLILSLLLVTALIFSACGKIKVNVDVSASVDVKTSEPASSAKANSASSTTASPDTTDPDSDAAGRTSDEPASGGRADEPADSGDDTSVYSNKDKIWRVYEMVNTDSSIPAFLYLEIDTSNGTVQIQHQYHSENTYSLEPWPLSDGLIDVKEFDGMGGPPAVWQEYIEYTEQVIKLHYVDDNDGTVDMDSYQEFHLQP